MPSMCSIEDRIRDLSPGLEIYRPSGSGPFPVVIQLHGCGGKKSLQGEWAKLARDAGWLAIVVDSYRHRRISTLEAYASVCTGMRLWGRERAGDLFAAMEWVRRQADALPDTIIVSGWSHGGWTAMDAMAMTPGEEIRKWTGLTDAPAEPLAGLAGAFLVYPFAGPGSLARISGLRIDVAPLAIVGGQDMIVGGKSLARTLKRVQTPGAPIRVEFFERATHAFDEQGGRDFRTRHDPELTARARALYVSYLLARLEQPTRKMATESVS